MPRSYCHQHISHSLVHQFDHIIQSYFFDSSPWRNQNFVADNHCVALWKITEVINSEASTMSSECCSNLLSTGARKVDFSKPGDAIVRYSFRWRLISIESNSNIYSNATQPLASFPRLIWCYLLSIVLISDNDSPGVFKRPHFAAAVL